MPERYQPTFIHVESSSLQSFNHNQYLDSVIGVLCLSGADCSQVDTIMERKNLPLKYTFLTAIPEGFKNKSKVMQTMAFYRIYTAKKTKVISL